MKAAAMVSPRKFEIYQVDIPVPKEDEVLIKVKACGVCSSELSMWENKDFPVEEPLFLGHEVSGVIEKVGSRVTKFSNGDRVTVFTERGGYAEYIAIAEKAAIKIDDHIPYELALGEPIACAINGAKRSEIQKGDIVVLIGLGFMGSLLLQGIKLNGASTIIAVDPRKEAQSIAKKLGADIVINPKKENLVKRVFDITKGKGADIVVESTGKQEPLNMT